MINIVSNPSKEDYNKLVTHPIQSWEWGEFRRQMGAEVNRFIINSGRGRRAGQVFFYRLPFSSFLIGHCPKINFVDTDLIGHLQTLGQTKPIIFIKIEPQSIKTQDEETKMTQLGLKKGGEIFSHYTMIIDLAPAKEELLAKFKPKTRYNIRLAQRKGVKISEDNSPKAFQAYWRLTQETTSRQRFYAHNFKYHQKMWQIMTEAKIAHLFLAQYQKEILAAWILFKFKDVLYYPYGASSGKHRNVMASNLMMWQAICFGKDSGCRQFDLWGTPGPKPKETDPWYGFHQFKAGYNPEIVELTNGYDLVSKPVFYQGYQQLNRIRWQWLKIKRSLRPL